ncbi:hypothetical protein BGX28_007547 [Mortierella sp. GBA30]|nr:hypothetical protein BGX28_007547 [Mortierella sp. GBA30]
MLIPNSKQAHTFRVALLLLASCTVSLVHSAPYQQQHGSIVPRADTDSDDDIEAFGAKQPNTPPDSEPSDPFAKYTYEQILVPANLAPTGGRTIVVGDIHGHLEGFEGFLKQVSFNPSKDELILAGDLVAKGPKSLEVIDRARNLNARCVRGNHDDKVIRWKGYLNSLSPSQKNALELDSESRPQVADVDSAPEYDEDQPQLQPLAQLGSIPDDLVENSEHHLIAKQMNNDQFQYLLSCPLILTLPPELSVLKVPVHVAHAGIDPRKNIADQQPWVLVNIRNILKDGTPYRKKKKGDGWAQVFNDKHSKVGADFLLVYGHDAGRSLNVKKWSIGLDSGCVYGRSLSGYVVETGQVYTVDCPKLDIEDDED